MNLGLLYSDDMYAFDIDLTINELVDGNLYTVGKSVTLNGQVGGDMFVIADTLHLTSESYVYGNLYVIANTITLDGIVCDLYTVCNKLSISENGVVLRDLRATATNLEIAGGVGRNTHLTTQNLNVLDTAQIYGNLNYSSNKAIVVPEGAVQGEINFKESDLSSKALDYVWSAIVFLVYTLVIWGLFLLFAPKFIAKSAEVLETKPLHVAGFGLLTTILLPIISVLLIFTIIGITVSFTLLGLYSLLLNVSFAIVTIALAGLIGNKVNILGKWSNLIGVILVSLVLWGLLQIPYVCFVMWVIIAILGLGIVVVSLPKRKE